MPWGGMKIFWAPNGFKSRSAGQFFPKQRNKVAHVIEPIAPGRMAKRQSTIVVNHPISGTKISWPAANADVNIPITSPLFSSNHLIAIVADRPRPRIPLAVPNNAPIPISKCHFSEAKIVTMRPETMSIPDRITTFTTPILSIKALPNGAIIASTKNINAKDWLISEIFHPWCLAIESRIIDGVVSAVDEKILVKNARHAITHA